MFILNLISGSTIQRHGRPIINRKLPDVIDTGEKQFVHQQQNNAVKSHKNDDSIVHSEPLILDATNVTRPLDNEKNVSPENIPPSSLILPQSKADNTCDDLIYLRGPCTEAAIINMLKMRFSKNILQVIFLI